MFTPSLPQPRTVAHRWRRFSNPPTSIVLHTPTPMTHTLPTTRPSPRRLRRALLATAFAAFFVLTGCDSYGDDPYDEPERTVVVASGDITAELAAFRAILGDSLNRAPGATTGRREIDWDGVPAAFSDNDTFAGDFFNLTDPDGPNGRKRGAVFATPGTGFRVSGTDLADVDPSYGAQFDAFSPTKTFVAVGSAVTDVTFKRPGEDVDAVVHGFGVVFSDVDTEGSATVEFFSATRSLGRYAAPAAAQGVSLVGVHFPNDDVVRARIVSGGAALGVGVLDVSDGGAADLVVMDDFLYDEPRAR